MKRRFQVLIEGVVRSNPDETTAEAKLAEMREAVEISFKPHDIQWGVKYNSFDVQIFQQEVGDSDT